MASQARTATPKAESLDFLGAAEVAEVLGVETRRLYKWQKNGVRLPDGTRVAFPEPLFKLRATPIWDGADIRLLKSWMTQPRRRQVEPFSEHAASRAA